jgi:hypothetical protein
VFNGKAARGHAFIWAVLCVDGAMNDVLQRHVQFVCCDLSQCGGYALPKINFSNAQRDAVGVAEVKPISKGGILIEAALGEASGQNDGFHTV